MVYGVSRIALPSVEWDASPRARSVPGVGQATELLRDFIAGPENRLIVPALERLLAGEDLSTAAQLFNPLVLLGATGTGKSQLARGIVRHWNTLLDESQVTYITAIDFARQLRAAREDGQLDSFRESLAELRLLVVEDLHRVPTSLHVQRELRDTFDALTDAGAVVIVTTQQPPAAMGNLEPGLRDRLSAGLTARLQVPGVEARFEILKQAASARDLPLSDEQLRQLAQKTEGTAPQLCRAVAEYEMAAGDAEFADTVHPPLKIKQIIAVASRYFKLTQAAICGSERRKSLVYARSVVSYLARSLTELSYSQIGQSLGRRDHTTVMHACRSIEKRLANDATTQQDIEELKRILTAA